MNVYTFVIFDVSNGKDVIYSYIYRKGKGKKYGNNIVLWFMNNFK